MQQAVRSLTGKEPFRGINPDECVAIGASLQAGVLAGSVQGLLLLDVTPLSLGIETIGGVFSKIIDRNTTLPISKSQVYTTATNFQTSVEIKVFQGERPLTRDNKLLGNFRLEGIQRALRGIPQINVTFSIDANGIVHVSAKDLNTGRSQEIVLTASSNLTQGEIDRAIRDAQMYADTDKRKKAEATARDEAENLLYRVSALPKKNIRPDKHRLDEAVKNVRRAFKENSLSDMLTANETLSVLLHEAENQ